MSEKHLSRKAKRMKRLLGNIEGRWYEGRRGIEIVAPVARLVFTIPARQLRAYLQRLDRKDEK